MLISPSWRLKVNIWLRNFLRQFGIWRATLLITLVAMVSSILLYLAIGTLFKEITRIGTFASAIIPLLVAAPISYVVLHLVQKLGLAERALLDAYSSLEQQVRIRTAELTAANRQLQDEIARRKRMEKQLVKNIERLRRSIENTIAAIATVTEIRDPFTAGHQRRVAQLACAIGEELGLTKKRIERLRLAAMVHDIGKINIPTEILIKPIHLSKAEYEIIESHPQIAYDILNGIEFSRPIARIVLQHHELFDGSGYPHGLSGYEIMLEARILAVADVVEAMASHRPYRPAFGIGETLEEIIHHKGTKYDPIVVEACLRVFYEKGFKFE